MKPGKMTRAEKIALAISFVLALPLWFVLFKIWPEQPPETLRYYLRDWSFAGIMLFYFGVVRAIQVWHGPQSERGAALQKGALEVFVGIVYFAFAIVGAALIWAFDRWVMQTWPFWVRFAVAVPLGFPAFFGFMMLGLWIGSILRGRILPAEKPQLVARKLAVPGVVLRTQLVSPLILRREETWLGWLCLPCLALSVGAWTGAQAALTAGKFDSAIFIASFALWIGLGGAFMLTQSGTLGRISATELKPRFRRAVAWQEVASMEESLARNLFGLGEIRVLQFQNATGKSLWNLTLSEIKSTDLEALEQLMPALRDPLRD